MVDSSWQHYYLYHELLCSIHFIGDVYRPTDAGRYGAEIVPPGMLAQQSWRSSMIKDFDCKEKSVLKNARPSQIIMTLQIPTHVPNYRMDAPAPFQHISTSTHFPNKSPWSHPIMYCPTIRFRCRYSHNCGYSSGHVGTFCDDQSFVSLFQIHLKQRKRSLNE